MFCAIQFLKFDMIHLNVNTFFRSKYLQTTQFLSAQMSGRQTYSVRIYDHKKILFLRSFKTWLQRHSIGIHSNNLT